MSIAAPAAIASNAVETAPTVKTGTYASKLSLWCDRFIEAGWLAAVIVAPLFFNIYSSRVFEPDKLTTVRSIALVMAVAWLVKWLEERHNPARDASGMRITWRTPLVLPTLLLVVVYMISTALSVAPRTSLLGSYQRLQGTYTTFSYIVIFLMVIQGMRTRTQLDRLINFIIINSLPIALYGMIQRAGLDPLPWGGDVTERVAGNMGNAIFIAAYLVMTFFLTLGKIAESFVSVLTARETRVSDIVRTAGYMLIAMLNVYVVWMLAGSRGPQLGWLVGMFFIILLLIQLLRNRKLRLYLTLGSIVFSLVVLVFLFMLNFNRSAFFDRLREFGPFSKMASVIQTSSGTNAVRVLIWDGAVDLVLPHQPLQIPNESGLRPDPFNAIRPLIGYGPESMYVAYNPFYPPNLAHFEARNASPDRSHNETWDSLVITGAIGFLAYMFLFGSFFYYGLKWIGLISSRLEQILFPVLWVLGGIAGALGTIALEGPELFGIGVAAGVSAGIVLYLVISVLINVLGKRETTTQIPLSLRDQVLLIALVSAVIAHFIEIHTGIAIASTRTHFWIYAAMLVVVGMGFLRDQKPASAVADAAPVTPASGTLPLPSNGGAAKTVTAKTAQPVRAGAGGTAASRRRRRAEQQSAMAVQRRTVPSGSRSFPLPPWFGTVAVAGIFLGLILSILAFDFINNSDRNTVPGRVFVSAFTMVKGQSGYGILAMVLVTWVLGAVILVADAHQHGTLQIPEKDNFKPLAAAVGLILSISMLMCVAYGTFIAGRLVDFAAARQNTVDNILDIAEQLSRFPAYLYVLIGITMVVSAWLLQGEEPYLPAKNMSTGGLAALVLGYFALFIFPGSLVTSNLQPIAADIVYKQASPWDQQGNAVLQPGTNVQGWDVAVEHYRKAIQLAPNEDFYYLWLGRALLEKAKTTQDTQALKSWPDDVPFTKVIDDGAANWNRRPNTLPSSSMSRDDLLTAARVILSEARVINPLNTDHSANLARMWRQSGDITTDPNQRMERFQSSSQEYQTATTLSPNNAVLWNEWGSLYLYSLNDHQTAMQKLDHSLSLDHLFDQTYLLRGELLMQEAAQLDQQRQQAGQALAQIPVTDTAKLEEAQVARDKAEEAYKAKLREARIEFTNAISVNAQALQAFNVITYIDQQLGDLASAISTTLAYIQKAPQDWNGYKNLALLYRDAGRTEEAKIALQQAIDLAPDDQKPALQNLLDQLNTAQR